MGYEYVNRRGERYYLLVGKTKTGKPKYYVSRKAQGVPVDAMPEGYEIFEQPERGIVSVRKVRPTRVRPEERDQLQSWTRELAGIEHFIIDLHGDSLVIYTPDRDPVASADLLNRIFGGFPEDAASIAARAHYAAMLRFTLEDAEKRLFRVERWCFRGSIDDWFYLASGKPLEALARKYLPHLNRESFFELM
jgi:hypothetical protein